MAIFVRGFIFLAILLKAYSAEDKCKNLLQDIPSDSSSPVLTIADGIIEGRLAKAADDLLVEEFLGIPFGQPPVGTLRFADPKPVKPWTGVFDATNYGPSCHQLLDLTFGNFSGSSMWNAPNKMEEDCLNLNVWTPHPRPKKAAVMVWIFGGGFYSGTSALAVYDGKNLATYADVIVVSMNYRVGSLGFFSTGDGRIKGNFGLNDQLLALQWINANIESFGGDTKRITIMGESAGAASVGFHYMSKQSHHLFTRGIMQSGSPTAHWAFMSQEQARDRSRKYLTAMNCIDDESALDCLRNPSLTPSTIVNSEWVDGRFLVFPWAPSVDGTFLTDEPANYLKNGGLKKTELLIGTNKDEGTFWILYAVPTYSKDSSSLQTWDDLLEAIDITEYDLSEDERKELLDLYTGGQDRNNSEFNRDVLDDIVGDRSFICPTIDFVDVYGSNETFVYHLEQRSSNEVWPTWMGVIHGADVQYVFGIPLNKDGGFTTDDELLSREIMTYWSNFAKYGTPNRRVDRPILRKWPKYGAMKKTIEFLPGVQTKTGKKLREKYCKFWGKI